MERNDWTRRDFLRAATAVGAAVPFSAVASPLLRAGEVTKGAAKVVWVEHPGVMDDRGSVNPTILGQMLDRALAEFTGEKDPAAALAKFISAEDVVGLKVNCLGLRSVRGTTYTSHFTAVVDALAERIGKVVKAPEQIVVWDRHNGDLQSAGYRINVDGKGVRCYGTRDTVGFDKQEYDAGGRKTRFSRILTEQTTALVNVPLVKTHRISGITGALKNHYGSIENPRDFHGNNCTRPGIPEINALPPVKDKTRLIIVDALWAVIEGGPRWNREFMRPLNSVWVSTDPVAIDRLVLDTIDRLRAAEKLPSREEMSVHVQLAAELGLGEARLEKIDLAKIKLA